jgi:hypothetical protein
MFKEFFFIGIERNIYFRMAKEISSLTDEQFLQKRGSVEVI